MSDDPTLNAMRQQLASTTTKLREFVETDKSELDVTWPEADKTPTPLEAGGRVILEVNNLMATRDQTMQEAFPDTTAVELLRGFVKRYRDERQGCKETETTLLEITGDLREDIQLIPPAVDEVQDMIRAARGNLQGGEEEGAVPGFEKVAANLDVALQDFDLAKREIEVANVMMRLLRRTISSTVGWLPWAAGTLFGLVRRDLWMGTNWDAKKSVKFWVSAMNELIATADPYFTVDAFSMKLAVGGLIDLKLPLHRAAVLSSPEKLEAIKILAELTIMLTHRSEHPRKGDALSRFQSTKDKVLRRASQMMRVLYAAMKEYARLDFESAQRIESLINSVATHSLTILYFLTYEAIVPKAALDFNALDAIDEDWFDSVYLKMDWIDTAEEFEANMIPYLDLFRVVQIARDDEAWLDPIA